MVSNGVTSFLQLTTTFIKRNAIHLSEKKDRHNERDAKNGNGKDDTGSGSATHNSRLNHSKNGVIKKTDEVKVPQHSLEQKRLASRKWDQEHRVNEAENSRCVKAPKSSQWSHLTSHPIAIFAADVLQSDFFVTLSCLIIRMSDL
ncbi:hypothetical protein BGZ95_009475 [Linnemannia exigua]|uniref:Uncharacterized protein n=1 Tax=Linnemannia exigua TaxID=604196 RepID=A0AAD4DEX9_9FUNG|nr:hypothetical protein BGZ95_009475 [Linnemannia exigua]